MIKRIKNTYIHDLREFLILWSTQSLSQLGSSMTAFALYLTNNLVVWHLYAVNAFSGLMNTVQQPASEVATTLLIPKEQYQRASGLQSLSRSLISILNPLFATALYGLAGLEIVIFFDLGSFVVAFLALLFLIKIPAVAEDKKESVLMLAKGGISMIFGSILVSVLPKPENRIKVVYITMLISMGIENYMMAFCREPWLWCLGQVIGWILVPVMSANYDVIFRSTVPVELQGRVYACRNTLQFFTIPIGLFLGGFMVDDIFEPFMEMHQSHPGISFLFGHGKGSGAAVAMFALGIAGTLHCVIFGRKLKKYKYKDN